MTSAACSPDGKTAHLSFSIHTRLWRLFASPRVAARRARRVLRAHPGRPRRGGPADRRSLLAVPRRGQPAADEPDHRPAPGTYRGQRAQPEGQWDPRRKGPGHRQHGDRRSALGRRPGRPLRHHRAHVRAGRPAPAVRARTTLRRGMTSSDGRRRRQHAVTRHGTRRIAGQRSRRLLVRITPQPARGGARPPAGHPLTHPAAAR